MNRFQHAAALAAVIALAAPAALGVGQARAQLGPGIHNTAATVPILQIGGTQAPVTYGKQLMSSVIIGSLCEVDVELTWSGLATGQTGAVTISGLPAACGHASTRALHLMNVAEYGVSTTPINATIDSSGNIVFTAVRSGLAEAETALDASALSAAGGFYISGANPIQ